MGIWRFVSSHSSSDWVCRGNGMADEVRLPKGDWVIEDVWGARAELFRKSTGIWKTQWIFFYVFTAFHCGLFSQWVKSGSHIFECKRFTCSNVPFCFPPKDHSENPLGAAVTLAHELGHNFGMNHDTPERGCGCRMTVDRGGCIMTPSTGWDLGFRFQMWTTESRTGSLGFSSLL